MRIIDEKSASNSSRKMWLSPCNNPSKRLDKQQGKLIERLQEGQDALTLTQTNIVKVIKAISGAPELPALPAPEALPAIAEAAVLPRATPISPEAPIVTYPIDEELINDLGLPHPSKVVGAAATERSLILANQTLNSLGGQLRGKEGSRPYGNQTQNRCCTRLYREA